jgi:hypothetical protein
VLDRFTARWARMSTDVLLPILAIVCAGALWWPATKAGQTISSLFLPAFSLTWIWIGVCRMPVSPSGDEAVEVYRISVHQEHVAFSCVNVLPKPPPGRRFIG